MKRLNFENISHLHIKGIYKIYLCDNDGKPKLINRVAKSDSTGLIYIGASYKQTIGVRLKNFLNTMNQNRSTNNHTAGNKISNNKILISVIEGNSLYFKCEQDSAPQSYEKTLIDKYIAEFGEKPPLNG